MYAYDIYPEEHVVIENPQDYSIMLSKHLWDTGKRKVVGTRLIKWAVDHLKKHARIVWYLRFVRLALADWTANELEDPKIYKKEVRRYNKKARAAGATLIPEQHKLVIIDREQFLYLRGTNYESMNNTFIHYFGYDLRKINEQPYEYLLPEELFTLFETYVKEAQGIAAHEEAVEHFQKTEDFDYTGDTAIISHGFRHDEAENDARFIPDKGDENPRQFIEFDDGWGWFDLGLDAGYCNEEKNAMDHCGNPSGTAPQIMLSLRKPLEYEGLKFWKPVLTFALDENGGLREMKGYNNTKPLEKYHEYVVGLLNDDIVESIIGGGYLPRTNFDLDDLSEELRAQVDVEKIESMKSGNRAFLDGELDLEFYYEGEPVGADGDVDLETLPLSDIISEYGSHEIQAAFAEVEEEDIDPLDFVDISTEAILEKIAKVGPQTEADFMALLAETVPDETDEIRAFDELIRTKNRLYDEVKSIFLAAHRIDEESVRTVREQILEAVTCRDVNGDYNDYCEEDRYAELEFESGTLSERLGLYAGDRLASTPFADIPITIYVWIDGIWDYLSDMVEDGQIDIGDGRVGISISSLYIDMEIDETIEYEFDLKYFDRELWYLMLHWDRRG